MVPEPDTPRTENPTLMATFAPVFSFTTVTNLYRSLDDLQEIHPKKILINQIFDENEVVQVFRKFFAKATG